MTPLPVLNCDGCSACCDTQGTPPMMMDEFEALPAELRWNRLEHGHRYSESLPCLWLRDGRCAHYDHRPAACRDAVVLGDEYCLTFRAGTPATEPMR